MKTASLPPCLTLRNRPAAFSLVELAVVIGILAVLLIVGLSANESFARKSREVGCTHNLRMLYQTFQSYLHDYGTLPFGAPVPRTDWEQGYFDQYGGAEGMINASYYSGIHARRMRTYLPGGNGANTGYVEPYLCPEDRFPRDGYVWGFLGHSYGFNMTIAREKYNRPNTWTHPAATFLLTDSKKDMIARTSPGTNLAPRHRNHANTLFLDGHVESRPAPFPNWSENRRFWVPDYEN